MISLSSPKVGAREFESRDATFVHGIISFKPHRTLADYNRSNNRIQFLLIGLEYQGL
jgi:hypothetical protein